MLTLCIGEAKMNVATHELNFHGGLLTRGFWLYVWDISTLEHRHLHYVGRTGDSSSKNAQSPFNRMGQHLGFNPRNNVLRRTLKSKDVDPEKCAFRLVAHGPILPEAVNSEEHRKNRDRIAAMEEALALALSESGYEVINNVQCRANLDDAAFGVVRATFSAHFRSLAG
jgi:hypothetical protein